MWFKIDDALHAHRKVRKVRRSHPDKTRDVAPFGIWALAGSWCGAHSTGGFIPLEVLEEFDDDAAGLATRLVDAGLWHAATQNGEKGYQFHDWAELNPSDASTSGNYGNHVRWHANKGIVSDDCEHCESPESAPDIAPSSPPNRPDDRGDHRPESGTNRSRPDPTRPDPTRNTRSQASFEEFWNLYPRKIGKVAAQKAWVKAAKSNEPETILTALRLQLPSIAMQLKPEGDFRAYPATWLNQGRWMDEPAPATPPMPATGTESSLWDKRYQEPTDD